MVTFSPYIGCVDLNVVPITLLFSFKSKISFGRLDISEMISHLLFALTFHRATHNVNINQYIAKGKKNPYYYCYYYSFP